MRRLLVNAVISYPGESDAFRQAIADQQAIVEEWWPSTSFTHIAADWQTRLDVEGAIHDIGLRDLDADDILMLIITGHGKLGQRHYLQFTDTVHDNQAGTGYPTSELVLAALSSNAQHVIVMVNSCFSGDLRRELASLVRDLPTKRQHLKSLAVFTTARHDQRPRAAEYAELLRRTYRQLRETAGINRDRLTVEEFKAELVRASHTEPVILEPVLAWPDLTGDEPSPCLPHPGYEPLPMAVDPSLAQVATRRPELDYWLDRASGRTDTDDPGWYFSGRQELARAIATFLASGRGALVITGAAATGKSALIARAVTLSDARLRNEHMVQEAVAAAPKYTVPPVGSVDAAVLARQKTAADLIADLVRALGDTPRQPASMQTRVSTLRHQLEELIRARDRRTTLVMDGLDEATDPGRMLVEVVGPLLRLEHRGQRLVRMIVGVRSARESDGTQGLVGDVKHVAAGADIAVRQTDGPDARDDIAEYVDRLLAGHSDAHSFYALHPRERTEVAAALADAVAPSFLDARVAAQWIGRSATAQDLDGPAWRELLGVGTFGLLMADIAEQAQSEPDAQQLLAVLQAAAFAQGNGVPWADVWPAIIEAILDRTVSDADEVIREVLNGRLVGYLTRDVEDDRIVYRPAHDLLSRALRAHQGGTPR